VLAEIQRSGKKGKEKKKSPGVDEERRRLEQSEPRCSRAVGSAKGGVELKGGEEMEKTAMPRGILLDRAGEGWGEGSRTDS
jgi:hypothetical protein